MVKYLIYLFPAFIDIVLGSVCYIPIIRLSESGSEVFISTSVISAWGIVYCICAWQLGKIINVKNSAYIIVFSAVLLAATCLGFIVFKGIYTQFIFIAVTGIATAGFFTPFQIFMKAIQGDNSKNLAKATGIYTFSWSMGIATGPFIAAWVWPAAGWEMCYIINIALAATTAIGILLLRNQAGKHSIPEKLDASSAKEYIEIEADSAAAPAAGPTLPDLAWLGWIVAGVCFAAGSAIRAVLPDKGTHLNIDKTSLGVIVSLICYSQGICGLLLTKSKTWMYKPLGAVGFGLCGIIGLAGIGFAGADDKQLLAISTILFGIYSGGFSFFFVFHSLCHPTKSVRYIAVNEIVVGTVSILAPLGAGFIAHVSNRNIPFYVLALIVGITMIFQVFVHRKFKIQGSK